jgi:DNA-binding NtrC family response regulator
LIAASHADLAQQIREKKFRSDLYFRVSTVVIRMPALRERVEDIPLLAQHFFQRMAVDLGRIHLILSERTLETLTTYPWPGNIRELKNVMERAVLLATGDTIQPRDLRLEYVSSAAESNEDPSHLTFREMQRFHIQKVLTSEQWNVSRAATRLGMTRSSLYNKIKTFGIVHPNGRN